MRRRRVEFDQARIQRLLEERAQGVGLSYRPWLSMRELNGKSSEGHTSNKRPIPCRLANGGCLLSESVPTPFDVYEQFPLDAEQIRRIVETRRGKS
jgi:hypothetical protein